jgi:imidazolonepropionase-like amidohydrolase
MKISLKKLIYCFLSAFLVTSSAAVFASDDAPAQILIKNVQVFDGTSNKLSEKTSVLIEGNLIKEISAQTKNAASTEVIDGGGRVLIPGLIDTHQHMGFPAAYPHLMNNVDFMWIGAASSTEAKAMLMRGFTTVRDAGGPAIGLSRAINEGRAVGPRIYPSGPAVSQTSGHGDVRNYSQLHQNMSGGEATYFQNQFAFVADGPDEVLRAVRESLRRGASQIKMTIGGGASSQSDPLHTTQYTVEEIRAGVQAARDWGTYVMVHAYHDESVRRALEAGVIGIDHGTLMTEKTMKLLKKKNGYLVPQARLFTVTDDDKHFFESFGPATLAKVMVLNDALDNQFKLAKKYKVKVGFGTDLFGSPEDYAKQSQEFEFRLKWFTPVEILKQATSINAEIVALCGELNPYKEGELGVIKPGAYADLLIVDGNPLEDIKLLGNPEKNLKLIMKDGKVYKNTL